MKSRRVFTVFLTLAALLSAAGGARAVTAPEARGLLSLAWDEMESGRCAEALKYVDSIVEVEGAPDGFIKEDAAWMRADCLLTLGRYEEAVDFLAPMNPGTNGWRDDFLYEIACQWAAELTGEGDYKGAMAALKRVGAILPKSLLLEGLAEATANRAELAGMMEKGRDGRLSGGGELKLLPDGKKPEGREWVKACPPEEGDWAVFEEECGQWASASPELLEEKGVSAWMRVPWKEFAAALKTQAGRLGMKTGDDGTNILFIKGEYLFPVEKNVALRRAAVEGLGIKGGALIATAEAERNINLQEELAGWMKKRLGGLKMSLKGGAAELTGGSAGRTTRFYLSEWVEYYSGDEPGWTKLWDEVTTELERAKRPYACFCGKPMVLRETLASSTEGLVSSKRGNGLYSVIIAACRDHWLMISEQTLKDWGVTKEEAFARAEKEAVDAAWNVIFERYWSGGAEYTVFSGTGISGIVKKPGLVLGLLTALDGKDMGGSTVHVLAPSPDSLIVGAGEITEQAGREGAKKAAGLGSRQSGQSGLLRYKESIKLPKRPEGVFNLSAGK